MGKLKKSNFPVFYHLQEDEASKEDVIVINGILITDSHLHILEMAIDNTRKYKERNLIKDSDIFDAIIESRNKELNSIANELAKEEKKDHLYLFLNTENGSLKIGRSANVKARLKQLNTSSPDKISCIFEIREMGMLERGLHEMFEPFRLNGEWFEYSEEIINYFKEL
jgi:hypothetical protein